MIRRLIKKAARSLLGQKPEPPTPQKRYEPPPPPNWMEQDNHEHSHSHEHGHEHSHNHTQESSKDSPGEEQSYNRTQTNVPSSIDVEAWETPNPNAYKFTVSKKVTEKSFSASSLKQAQGNPLATALLSHSSVASVFGVNDFVTVTKSQDSEWTLLIPEIIQIIKDNV
jgi:hypothetical protein